MSGNPINYKERFVKNNCCVLIPTFNNDGTIKAVIESVLSFTEQVIVVNDGSTDSTAEILGTFQELDVLDLGANCGKGIALRRGFKYALEKGYEYAITIDSDGQHLAEDLPSFLEKIEREPDSIIMGARNMTQEGIPGKSSFGHKFSNFWYKVETGINLPDTQSGFRLYPLRAIKDIKYVTSRFEFEIEVIVKAAWSGVNITSVPVKVIYFEGDKRVSHFRPITDFLRITVLNTFLVILAFIYGRPRMLIRKLRNMSFKEFVEKHIVNSSESNKVKAISAGFGVFMGIVPIWGYQMALAIIIAIYFRLNKAIVLLTAQVSLPPLIPFVIYASYLVGDLLLTLLPDQGNVVSINNWIEVYVIPDWLQEKFPAIVQNVFSYFIGSIALAVAAAIITGLLTYISLSIFRRNAR